MNRMDELWKDMGRTDTPTAADARAVKARVHAALDADPAERKVYMRQKTRFALAAAALALAVTGSALAVSANLDVLQAFFQGDTSPAQEYMDRTVRSVSDENYTLTVESSVADENTAYLVVTVKALNEESRQFLFSKEFTGMDTFHVGTLNADGTRTEHGISGFGMGELKEARTENSISWYADADLTGPAAFIRIRLDYMGEDKEVRVPLNPAPSVAVEINTSGVGIPDMETTAAGTLTVERVTLTPLTCKVLTADEPRSRGYETHPRVFFRMADGSIRTQSQMMESTGSHTVGDMIEAKGPDDVTRASVEHDYRFREVQDLSLIRSVIVFDQEFPLDGSKPKTLAHDAALDPFQVPTMEALSEGAGYSLPVRALTESLGGTCDWDADTGNVTCVYRGITIVLASGSDTATVDGAGVTLKETPAVQNGTLASDYQLFFDAWGLDGFVQRTKDGDDTIWGDWYIIP